MARRKSGKSGGDIFVVEVPRTERRELQLIGKQGLVAVWIKIKLEELGEGRRCRQFRVEPGKIGKKPTLQVTCPTWAKELDLEAHLRDVRRQQKPKTLRGWTIRFEYVERLPRTRRKRLSPESSRAVLEALIDGAMLQAALFPEEK